MRLTQEEVQKIKEKAINGHMIREHGYDDEGNFIDRGISYLPAHMVYKDEGLIDLCDTIEALQQENKQIKKGKLKIMDKLKEIIQKGYLVWISNGQKGFYIEVEKQWKVDEFEEWKTSEYPTIEEAVEEAYKNITKRAGEKE